MEAENEFFFSFVNVLIFLARFFVNVLMIQNSVSASIVAPSFFCKCVDFSRASPGAAWVGHAKKLHTLHTGKRDLHTDKKDHTLTKRPTI